MRRGKQQVLLELLPGKTFDFERVATIARVKGIRGVQRTDLSLAVVLQKVGEEAQAWEERFRPALRDDVLRDPSRFVLLEPKGVQAEIFPKVFWCQNRGCGQVIDYSNRDTLPPVTCPRCKSGKLVQLRFVKVHRCGALDPLLPPTCPRCGKATHVALDTRGSERIANFRWICRSCNTTMALFGGRCHQCDWPSTDGRLKNMDIEVHRAGRTFYAHTVVLLNVPERRLEAFFNNLPEWPAIAAAKFLDLPEISSRSLSDFTPSVGGLKTALDGGLSAEELDDLLRRRDRGELTAEQLVAEMEILRQRRQKERESSSPSGIVQALEQRTGVLWSTWKQAAQEMLEAVMLLENGSPNELFDQASSSPAVQAAQRLGLSRLALVSDFPMVMATYGYSRAEYAPNQCRLNPFPPERDHGGKFPIYVDLVQADALLLRLNPERVCVWLERNGFPPTMPPGSDTDLSRQAYFVQLFEDVPLRKTIRADKPQARLVFGLLHTFSHLSVRQAALLCGLDRTSLSEYILPRTLTFALYCNHRFGATIGALTSLFEQSLTEWLSQITNSRRCVYDPVCGDRSGSCHACTHLAETSCRFFNLNLSRAFLFGGRDPKLGFIKGYFDPSL